MKKTIVTTFISSLILLLPNVVFAQVVIALDDQLKEYWVTENKIAPKYPRMALRRGIMGCAAVGYIIQADGSTRDHKILAYYPSDIFDKSAIKAAKQFIFTPTEQNPDRVSVITSNVFTYHVSDDQHGGSESGDEKRELLQELCSKAGRKALEGTKQ